MWIELILLTGVVFGIFLVWPRTGGLARWRQLMALQHRAQVEDALKHLHTCEWRGQRATLESLCGALRLTPANAVKLAAQMEQEGLAQSVADGLRLTPEGARVALGVIRAHRLWERYLADEARMPLTQIHAEAERREHEQAPQALEALEAALGYPTLDPHGDPIPTPTGELARLPAQPLTAWPLHTAARVIHIEDEPATLFAQIAAIGLRPGQIIQVLEATPQRLVITDGNALHTLAPVVAANIAVAADDRPRLKNLKPLSALTPGQHATIHTLADSLQGFTRRRLLDLGLTPGAGITVELPSMFNDPVAYRVRGTLIALRRDQAEQVLIQLN